MLMRTKSIYFQQNLKLYNDVKDKADEIHRIRINLLSELQSWAMQEFNFSDDIQTIILDIEGRENICKFMLIIFRKEEKEEEIKTKSSIKNTNWESRRRESCWYSVINWYSITFRSWVHSRSVTRNSLT